MLLVFVAKSGKVKKIDYVRTRLYSHVGGKMSQGSGLSRAYLGLVLLEPNKSSSLIFLQKRYDFELSKKTREREEASNIKN